MTGDSLNPEQPPSGPLSARESASTPAVGPSRGAGGASGPQAGVQSFDTEVAPTPCTASITNEYSRGTHHCVLEAGHQDPEWGGDHAGPEDENGTRYRWSDKAIGAVPHQGETEPTPAPTALREQYAAAIDADLEQFFRDHPEEPRNSPWVYGMRDAAAAVRAADAVRDQELEQPASTAPLAAGLTLVQGHCPACGGSSLFLGDGGYVTCSRIDCPIPDSASTLLCLRPDTAPLRHRYAAAIYEYNNPGMRWADAHPDDLICYGGDADAALRVRDLELEQAQAERDELRNEITTAQNQLHDMARKRGEWQWRAETAEAAVDRVRKALDDAEWGGPDRHDVITEIRAALDPQEQP